MSGDENEAVDTSCCCASCGVSEIDDIKLVPCDACYLVRYCSDECREDHKSEHEEACKIRAAELREELLFKQPESSHLGDCPICSLPLPLDEKKSSMYNCCSKVICNGCDYANVKREMEMRLQPTCPFCRESMHITEEEYDKRHMKRVEANDPLAMGLEGVKHMKKGEYSSAIEYFTRAADLGDVWAHVKLALMYHDGQGVEKDEGKHIHHAEEAAIGGNPNARCLLAMFERKRGNKERAVKHYIIAASQGEDGSMQVLMELFKSGFVGKEVLAATFRAQKAAIDATKSPQRLAAEEYRRSIGGHPESAAGRR